MEWSETWVTYTCKQAYLPAPVYLTLDRHRSLVIRTARNQLFLLHRFLSRQAAFYSKRTLNVVLTLLQNGAVWNKKSNAQKRAESLNLHTDTPNPQNEMDTQFCKLM